MKRFNFILICLLSGVLMINSCSKEESNGNGDGSYKFSFWMGAIENKIVTLDMCGGKTHIITGKPYMVLEYDPITRKPKYCEFGFSEMKESNLPKDEFCLGAAPKPTLGASTFLYAKRLGIKDPVALFCNFAPVTVGSTLPDGGFDFTVKIGKQKLHFEKNNVSMTGEVVNEGQSDWNEYTSEPNAINMLHKFDSNTVGS